MTIIFVKIVFKQDFLEYCIFNFHFIYFFLIYYLLFVVEDHAYIICG